MALKSSVLTARGQACAFGVNSRVVWNNDVSSRNIAERRCPANIAPDEVELAATNMRDTRSYMSVSVFDLGQRLYI